MNVTAFHSTSTDPMLRRKHDAPPAHFIVPGGTIISVVAVALSIWWLSSSTYYEAHDSALVIAVGVVNLFTLPHAASERSRTD